MARLLLLISALLGAASAMRVGLPAVRPICSSSLSSSSAGAGALFATQ